MKALPFVLVFKPGCVESKKKKKRNTLIRVSKDNITLSLLNYTESFIHS